MKIAAVFPGQGSQSIGMLSALNDIDQDVKGYFAAASDVLGYDLWALIQEGSVDQLKQTEFTQPAMFVAGYACYKSWLKAGGAAAQMCAGHSLGEYTAMTVAGVFAFEDAVKLVQRRAQLMSVAVPEGRGGMAAVLGLSDDDVKAICEEQAQGDVLEAVNFNSPAQVVVSGDVVAMERALPVFKERGAKRALLLPVSVPNHSQLMNSVVAPLSEAISAVSKNEAEMPVIQNLSAKSLGDLGSMMGSLKQHVNSPVYWTDSVNEMVSMGADVFIEFGPGKVLAGLVKRIDKSVNVLPVYDPASLQKALEQVSAAS